MSFPFALPNWLPAWLGLVLALIVGLWALALLAMPFAVFGVKSRLDAIEEQLDAVQDELRGLTMRLPEPLRGVVVEEAPYDALPRVTTPPYRRRSPQAEPQGWEEPRVPPIPPAPPAASSAQGGEPRERLGRDPQPRPRGPQAPSRGGPAGRRIEPRLD